MVQEVWYAGGTGRAAGFNAQQRNFIDKFNEKVQARERDLEEARTSARDMCREHLSDGDGTFAGFHNRPQWIQS
jgi:hypothetical protein